MPKQEVEIKVKRRKKKEDTKIEVSASYLQALEGIIAEQRIRVILYQQVIAKASEELG